MPRPIKNDQPSNAQLQDLIRPIVKSEIRRRDGAITSLPLDPDGALEFTTSGLAVKAGTDGMILPTSGGLELEFFDVSGSDLALNVPSGGFDAVTVFVQWTADTWNMNANSDMTFTALNDQIFTANNQLRFQADSADILCLSTWNVLCGGTVYFQCYSTLGFYSDDSQEFISGGIITIQANYLEATFGTTDGRACVYGPQWVSIALGTTSSNLLTGLQLNTTTAYLMASASTITTQLLGYTPASAAVGGPVQVKGGSPSAGTNVNAGLAELTGGQPRGTGTSTATIRVINNAGTALERIAVDLNGIGFFGKTPIARPGTYTITAAPAVAVSLNADANGGAYTGVPAALADAATRTDLNDLRADLASAVAVLRQLIKHLGDTSGLGLVDETGY